LGASFHCYSFSATRCPLVTGLERGFKSGRRNMVLSKAKTVSIVFRAELDESSGVFFAKTRTPPDCVRVPGRGLGNPQLSAARIIVVMRAPLGKHASGPEVPHGTSGTTSSKASTPNYNTVPLFDVSDAVSVCVPAQHVPRRLNRGMAPRAGKGEAWEGGYRAPLVVRWPGSLCVSVHEGSRDPAPFGSGGGPVW
jgi:hypothetical protein